MTLLQRVLLISSLLPFLPLQAMTANDALQNTVSRNAIIQQISNTQNATSLGVVLQEITETYTVIAPSREDQIQLLIEALLRSASCVTNEYYEHLETVCSTLEYWQTINNPKKSLFTTIVPYFSAKSPKTQSYENKLKNIERLLYQQLGMIDLVRHDYKPDNTIDAQWVWCTHMLSALEPPCQEKQKVNTPLEAFKRLGEIVNNVPLQKYTLKRVIGKASVPLLSTKTYVSLACLAALGTYAAYRIQSGKTSIPSPLSEGVAITIQGPYAMIQHALSTNASTEDSIESKIIKILEPSIPRDRFKSVSHDTATRTIAHITSCYRILGTPDDTITSMLDKADAYNRISKGDYHLPVGVLSELLRALSKDSVISSVLSKNNVTQHILVLFSLILEILDINVIGTHYSLRDLASNNQTALTGVRRWAQLMMGCAALTLVPYASFKIARSLWSITQQNQSAPYQKLFLLLYDMELLLRDTARHITPESHGKILFYGHCIHNDAEHYSHECAKRIKEAVAAINSYSRNHDTDQCIARIDMIRLLLPHDQSWSTE